MKSTILKITFLTSVVIAGLTSCSNSTSQKAEDVEEAKTNLADAKEDLTQARLDSAKEYGQYRESAELRLQKNDEEIAELKAKMKADKKQARADYEEQLNELKERNEKLKSRMQEYREEGRSNWEAFKKQFNDDMDNVGKSISAQAEKNNKK